MGKNYYVVLGLAQNATDHDIRRRFKKLARETHPDRFQGEAKLRAERDFQALTEAFNVLTDPERRRIHDADLSRAGSPRGAGAAGDQGQMVKAFLARGVQAYKEGDFGAARESFERATEVDPESAQGWYNLALTCSRQERWLSGALAAAEKACELEPMKPAYLKLAGRLFGRAGRTDRAQRFLEEVLTWGGSDAEVEAELEELRGRQKGRRGFFGKAT
jgi:curved DNA-binding protein CbpA